MSIFKPQESELPKPHPKYGMFYVEEAFRDAAYTGDLSKLQQLQKAYPQLDINAKDEYGQTALYLACKKNHVKIAEHLLNQKADVNIPTILGNSCLLISAWNDNTALAKTLVEKNADIHATTNADRKHHGNVSALDIAVERGNTELREYLQNLAYSM